MVYFVLVGRWFLDSKSLPNFIERHFIIKQFDLSIYCHEIGEGCSRVPCKVVKISWSPCGEAFTKCKNMLRWWWGIIKNV